MEDSFLADGLANVVVDFYLVLNQTLENNSQDFVTVKKITAVMSCCNPYITHFSNVSSTTIGYGPSLSSEHGPAPKVTVLYWDGTQYVAAGIFTSIAFDGFPATSVTVDHGGPATGIIKLG